ncbi:uncharacterized protein V1518DRAFT_418997 [Limtongia smithiae]|uniref:uncharacterized protein n=1 Tax=Limtongia smithiae TaxID=1125753 RepID=UPI0034CF1256
MSSMHHRAAASGNDETTGLLATTTASSSSSATLAKNGASVSIAASNGDRISMSEEELLRVKGNDYGFPLLIQYESMATLWRNMPNMLLENKGAVARDHLANERNYLAWVRTSLSFATIGLAITQAFRGYGDGLLIAGKIIGALFIVLAISLMIVGAYRYYIVAIWLQREKFPPGRASVFTISVAAILLILTGFILILVNTTRMLS